MGIIHNKGIKKDECLIGALFLHYIIRRISENTKNNFKKAMHVKEMEKLWGKRGMASLDRVKKKVSAFVLLSTNLQIY